MGLFDLARWPSVLLLVLAGVMAVCFAFITVNLFSQAMANLDFIRRHGLMAIEEGALVQLGQLTLWGGLALFTYLGYKASEVELLYRYHDWSGRRRAAREGREGADGPGTTPSERRRRFRFRRR